MDKFLSKKDFLIAYSLGAFAGVWAWFYGQSWVPSFMLQWMSGIGFVLVIAFCFSALFMAIKFRNYQPLDCFTEWLSRYCIRGGAKGAAFLFGSITIAAVCWLMTDSVNAIKFAANGLILMGAFAILTKQLHGIRNDAIERGS